MAAMAVNGEIPLAEINTNKEDATATATATETSVMKHRGWKTMPYVIGNETFEKLGTIGISANMIVYLTTVFHLEGVTAVTLLSIVNGTTNFTPVIGAFVSDAYLGRFLTLAFASISSLAGMVILTLTAAISKLHPPSCLTGEHCAAPTAMQMAVLLCGFGFLVVGAGGIRPCNLAFGADQFDSKTESGRRGINSFFNWYYFTLVIAVMISSTVIIYIQSEVSWSLGLAIPAMIMFLSCAVFFLGSSMYVKVKPAGSPFTSIARVVVAAFRKRRLELPAADDRSSLFDPPHLHSLNSKLPHTDQFRFFDKAAIISGEDGILTDGTSRENPWSLCSLQQIEEVKCVLRIIPIWSTGILYYVAMAQQQTYMVYEALQSDRHVFNTSLEIPAASFSMFSMLAMTLWIPIYDRLIVPWFRRMTGKEGGVTLLQRMGVGLVLSTIAMVVSAIVEIQRRKYAIHHPAVGTASGGGAISSMSSLWLIPQLLLLGLAEAFNSIAQVEFYYMQFPENMRSVAGSLFFLGVAISNYLNGALVGVVDRVTGRGGGKNWLAGDLNEGKLDYFYLLIAGLGVTNIVYFAVCAKWYKYKKIDNNGGVGEISLVKEGESDEHPV